MNKVAVFCEGQLFHSVNAEFFDKANGERTALVEIDGVTRSFYEFHENIKLEYGFFVETRNIEQVYTFLESKLPSMRVKIKEMECEIADLNAGINNAIQWLATR